ncbi:hypothetical protein AMJ71_02960 [candidate division TA06 bacterium SM1_40]|uniref:LTD domain-containing protein n=2 Tax=Bacteria division TA06 TaxID=1156500 RepID=A0A0S8JLF8_UNCT6|nr:MAG: hypothetical protein AMJ71_02960 [candidate division TA06 bacterium SM1_40]
MLGLPPAMYHVTETILFASLAGVLLVSHGSGHVDDDGVVINEVMANVAGRESGPGAPGDRNEFIELYNRSLQAIDVSGWIISDGDADDQIEAWMVQEQGEINDPDAVTGTTQIPSHGYAVILDREYAATDSMSDDPEPYDLPPQTVVLTVGNTTLGDGLSTTDPIFLCLPESPCIDTYGTPEIDDDGIPYDPGDGISMERLDPWLGDCEENWAPSSAAAGSTPGGANASATRIDLATVELDAVPQRVDIGDAVTLKAYVANLGRQTVDEFSVSFFRDLDLDYIKDSGEEIATATLPVSLERGDTTAVVHEWTPGTAGGTWIGAGVECTGDEDSTNDVASTFIAVGGQGAGVVLNEIMYRPLPSCSEWIELLNTRPQEISLEDFSIEDDDSARSHRLQSVFLASGAYLVLVDDSLEFVTEHSTVTPIAVPDGGLPSLDDIGDLLRLRDREGSVIDSVCYDHDWGGERGISLERVNPAFPSNDPHNWGSSVAHKGATPGKRNSIFLSQIAPRASLTVAPNPFSPDGDGRDDRTVIAIRLPSTRMKVRLHIFDPAGRPVRRLLEQEETGGEHSVVWDGRADDGRPLPVGIYVIYLEGLDDERGTAVRETCTVVLAKRLK